MCIYKQCVFLPCCSWRFVARAEDQGFFWYIVGALHKPQFMISGL